MAGAQYPSKPGWKGSWGQVLVDRDLTPLTPAPVPLSLSLVRNPGTSFCAKSWEPRQKAAQFLSDLA